MTIELVHEIFDDMKPDDWINWTSEEKASYAQELINSERGYFLMNEALQRAAAMARHGGEESNAQDLELIREALFPAHDEIECVAELDLSKLCDDEQGE